MKMQSVLAFGFACFFFSLLACKEKSDQDCLIGDWEVIYAVDGAGRSCIGNFGNIVRETVIGFTANKVTWVDTDIDGTSGMNKKNISSGSYQWIGNTIDMTLVANGVSTQLNSTVALTDCDELHLKITYKNSPGMLYREIKAIR